MARKPLTERQERLKAAYEALEIQKAQLRTIRGQAAAQKRRVEDAQRVIDALGECDGCGAHTYPTGAELQLCDACGLIRREEQRVALLAAHGYDARGRRKVGPALSA
jgi:hypothetical protein